MKTILEKMMGGSLEELQQQMMGNQKEIEDYKVVVGSTIDVNNFNSKANELIKSGYIPIGYLNLNEGLISKEFIKYKEL